MKLTGTQSYKSNYSKENKQNKPNFKSLGLVSTIAANPALSTFFRSFEYNEMIGPSVVDICSMTAPRTMIDATRVSEEDKKKGVLINKDAAVETFRRESAGLLLHCILPGFVAAGGAWLYEHLTLGKDFKGLNLSSVNANSNVIDITKKHFLSANGDNKELAKKLLHSLQGLEGENWKTADTISKSKDFEKLVKTFEDILSKEKIDKEKKNELIEDLGKFFGARKNFRQDLERTKKAVIDGVEKNVKDYEDTKLLDFIDNSHSLNRVLSQAKEKVKNASEQEIEARLNSVTGKLKDITKAKTFFGVGMIAALAFSVQAVNRYLTKKKTGKAGFAGTNAGGVDNSTSFKIQKGLAMATLGGALAANMGKEKLKNLGKTLQFKSLAPSMNQLKVIYVTAVMGRLFASTDKNELRETGVRDGASFFTWLVLGDFVNKFVVSALDNTKKGAKLSDLANKIEDEKNNTIGKFNSFLKKHIEFKSIDEVLDKARSELNIKDSEIPSSKNGFIKIINKMFDAIGMDTKTSNTIRHIKEMAKNGESAEVKEKATKVLKQISILNTGQFSGILFSCVTLGIVLPWFNKVYTNRKVAENKVLAKVHNTQTSQTKPHTNVIFANNVNVKSTAEILEDTKVLMDNLKINDGNKKA